MPLTIDHRQPPLATISAPQLGDVRDIGDLAAAAQARLRHLIALRAVARPWWPRGVGLHVDEGDTRNAYEPPEGARRWIQLRRQPLGERGAAGVTWETDALVRCTTKVPGDELRYFCGALLAELRADTAGLSSRAAMALPPDYRTLLHELSLPKPQAPIPAGHWSQYPRPKTGALTPGEVLTRKTPLPCTGLGARADVQPIHGQVAAALGAVLHERLDWHDPLALSMAPLRQLEDLRSRAPDAKLAWSLAVAPEGGDIALMLHEGETIRSLGTVLVAGGHLQGSYLFRPQTADDMEALWQAAGKDRNGECRQVGRVLVPAGVPEVAGSKPLAGIHRNGRIVVTAHGMPLPVPGRLPYCRTVGGKLPGTLARELIQEGLPKDFQGSIHLDACGGGSGPGDLASYAHRFHQALARRGFPGVTVAASPGISHGDARARRTLPAHLVSGSGRTIRASRALIRNLERENRRSDVDAEHHEICARLIAQERDHIDRIQALNSPAAGPDGGARKLPWRGKLTWVWKALRTIFGRYHGPIEPWSMPGREKEDRAEVRGIWGRIGPQAWQRRKP